MMTKFWSAMFFLIVPVMLYSATSTIDICYIDYAGTCQYCVGAVAAVEDTAHTWSDKETGAVTACSETGAVLAIASDLTMPDWMANSVTAQTTDYIVDDIVSPTRIIRHGTAALLLAENDTTDEKGDITWTNNDSVPFEGTTVRSGSYSAGPFNDDADAFYSSAVVAVTIKSIEFAFIYFDSSPPVNRYIWCANNDTSYAVQMESNFIRARNGGTWTGTFGTSINTWYDVAVEMNGAGVRLIVDGVERATSAGTGQPYNIYHYWGNNSSLLKGCNCILDNMRLSLEARDSYPTIGDY